MTAGDVRCTFGKGTCSGRSLYLAVQPQMEASASPRNFVFSCCPTWPYWPHLSTPGYMAWPHLAIPGHPGLNRATPGYTPGPVSWGQDSFFPLRILCTIAQWQGWTRWTSFSFVLPMKALAKCLCSQMLWAHSGRKGRLLFLPILLRR